MKTILLRLSRISIIASLLSFSLVVSAHAVVQPSAAATSQYQNFSLGVPNEKDSPTTAVRLLIPSGVDRVTPFVKPGWRIEVIKDATGTTTEIRWSGGSVPAGQKDVFQFTARTPAQKATLVWRVYQTYQGGTVVSWDQNPKAGSGMNTNPYSVTEVTPNGVVPANSSTTTSSTKGIAIAALALSVVALVVNLRRRTA